MDQHLDLVPVGADTMRIFSSICRLMSIIMTIPIIVSCAQKNDEAQIRELIKKGAQLAEKRDVKGVLELTTEDFAALPGEMDRRDAKKMLFWIFRRYGEFRIVYPKPSLDVSAEGGTASATVVFLMVKKDQSFPNLKELYEDPESWMEEVGERADLYRIRLELAGEGGDWLVRKAKLEPFRGLGFSE